VHDEAQDRALEPGVLEGQLLGAPAFQTDAFARGRTSDREHPLGRIDAPDPSTPLGERRGERARPAADIEDAAAEEVALRDQEVNELPPALVERTEPVIVLREGPEVRRVRR
jgi:hypothetical protein